MSFPLRLVCRRWPTTKMATTNMCEARKMEAINDKGNEWQECLDCPGPLHPGGLEPLVPNPEPGQQGRRLPKNHPNIGVFPRRPQQNTPSPEIVSAPKSNIPICPVCKTNPQLLSSKGWYMGRCGNCIAAKAREGRQQQPKVLKPEVAKPAKPPELWNPPSQQQLKEVDEKVKTGSVENLIAPQPKPVIPTTAEVPVEKPKIEKEAEEIIDFIGQAMLKTLKECTAILLTTAEDYFKMPNPGQRHAMEHALADTTKCVAACDAIGKIER